MHASLEDFDLPTGEELQVFADRLRLLADPTRLAVVCALAQGETNPSCLSELTGVPGPALSQHLAKLRLAGVCRARRDGQRVWYELADDEARRLVTTLLETSSTKPAHSGRRR